ncbi:MULTISPECIES: hypothetical protein [unclassified Pseudoclavibacter]|uniref:hypothetical protein n=1 Tax=unclassified Pseudoclavibacter TaxID=2615177 RepID=UPI001BA89F5F|nr:hypothetical protein [Pseudoclavibacter sp. Marseille-Q4354]MBS3180040.1 hypothetical protein [Pseudoclavibacter sp. Marseille-Q4354]
MTTRIQYVGNVKLSDLSQRLYVYASAAARKALETPSEVDILGAVQRASAIGEAFEWLTRSAIAKVHPALLAKHTANKASASLVALTGSATTTLPAAELRTVDMSVAVQTVQALYASMTLPAAAVDQVLSVRNAAAHMAMSDADSTHAALVELTALAKILLDAVERSEGDFWGEENLDMVVGLREKRLERLEAAIQMKISAAQARYRELIGDLGAEETARIVALLNSRRGRFYVPPDEEDHAEDCVACPGRAIVTYLRVPADDDALVMREGYVERPVWLVAEALVCPVCALELDDEELASLERFEYSSESEDPIIEDPADDYEPDWKEFSGR